MTEPATTNSEPAIDRRRFDHSFPEAERLPARLVVSFVEDSGAVQLVVKGTRLGDSLTDASRLADSYRFHDALHLALGVRLGWSPVLRAMLRRKRRSDPATDECEDGGRACMVEEAVCHLIHVHRDDAGSSEGLARLVDVLARVTKGFEVETSSPQAWAEAVSLGLSVMSQLVWSRGGTLEADFVQGTLRRS
jgi:hypothetical protein